VLDHTAELGGAELALARLARALDPSVVQLHLITFAPGPLTDELRRAGHAAEVVAMPEGVVTIDRHRAGRASAGWSALRVLPFVWRLAQKLRGLDVDLVHTTSLKADLIGVPVARLIGRPLVWHVHDRIASDYLPASMVHLIRALARWAPVRVVANSRATAATLPRARGLSVIHPGLAPEQLTGHPPFGVQGERRVGVLGRISPTKAQLEFVRAAAIVATDRPDVRFRVVGGPTFGAEDYERQVRAEVGRLGMSDRFTFTGFVDEPGRELDAMTVCVHTASVPEPFGQVVAEAMARWVPVVATAGGGVDEIFAADGADAGPVGWLVPAGDTDALASAVAEVLDDPAEASRRAASAWQRVRTRFSISETATAITTVWTEAVRASGVGPDRRSKGPRPRVAIAHDYLTQRGGAERVVLAMLRAFPDATIYTTLYDPEGTYPEFREARIVTSPLNRSAFLRGHHRAALPFMPYAASRLRVDADVVVSSSSGWAHGFPTSGRKLVYCHAPARWLYQSETYLGSQAAASAKARVLGLLTPWLRRWDRCAAATADRYVVNSTVVRGHVRAAYGIDAPVLPPPFGVEASGEQTPVAALLDWEDDGFHLVVSRLLPYKNVDQVIEAFRDLPERLVIVGRGPLEDELRAVLPVNARLVGGLSDDELRWVYAHARALVAPSIEDFGLTPLEGAAFGRPTLALRAGGYLDTIAEGVSGAFFDRPTAADIRAAVETNRGRAWDEDAIRRHADTFSETRFREQLFEEVGRLLPQA
jgi:glycosyltransferase involved in cell wall biosynthesis